MVHIDHLEVVEEVPVCDVHVGKFSYTDAAGETYEAEFYVKVPQDEESNSNPHVKAARVEAYNEQLTDEFDDLSAKGCSQIVYKEVVPIPIF